MANCVKSVLLYAEPNVKLFNGTDEGAHFRCSNKFFMVYEKFWHLLWEPLMSAIFYTANAFNIKNPF